MRGLTRALVFALVLAPTGCATLQQLGALQRVAFTLVGTANASLAGVSIADARNYDQLSATDIIRVTANLTSGSLPLEADVLVGARNPEDNMEARLAGLDWTLFLDGRETVSGQWDDTRVLPPGQTVTVPVRVRVDLLEFFDGTARQLIDLALAAAGSGEPSRIRLEAIPTVQTAIGPIRYPQPIRIEYEVGAN